MESLAKKVLFLSIPGSLTKKTLARGFTICSSAGDTLGSRPFDSCCLRWSPRHAGAVLSRLLLQDRLRAFVKEGQVPSLSSISQTCVISLIINRDSLYKLSLSCIQSSINITYFSDRTLMSSQRRVASGLILG